MTQPVTLLVSIDTEEDNWQPARSGITVENIRELPRLHRLFESLGVRPTYFATYQVAIQPWAAEILRDVCANGTSEVGAHLHAWNTPPLDEAPVPRNTMLWNLPKTLQVAKIATLTDALGAATGQRPQLFRAGRWGFGQSTAAALIECGYRVDSSITSFQSWTRYDDGPSHVGAPLDAYYLNGRGDPRVPVSKGPLIEVPVSSGYNRGAIRHWSRLHAILERSDMRHLRIPALAARLGLIKHITLNPEMESLEDMLAVSRHLIAQDVRHLHVTWHSASLCPGLTPFVSTRRDADRLAGVLATYVEHLAAMTPLRFATVGEAASALVSPPLVAPAPPVVERRLVVISYHHPPDGAIGGMRWAGLTKSLRRLGWKSWIVTAASSIPSIPTANSSATEVVSCPPYRTLNDFYRRLRRRNGHGKGIAKAARAAPVAAPPKSNRKNGLLAQLRLEAALLMWWPDEGRGWVLHAAARARKLIRQMKPDVVVSTGPPHSAHLVAWLATWGLGTRRIVDLRDPWAGPFSVGWQRSLVNRTYLSRWLTTFLERFVISKASGVLCNTKEFAQAMRPLYPRVSVDWLPNGVDPELLPRAADPLPGLGMVHIGTIYGGRDLRPVLQALRVFLDRHPEAAAQGPAFRIAGALDHQGARDAFRRESALLGLQDQVAELGILSRKDALQLAARARLALVLAQDQELQVPAKLYELVAIGTTTLVIADAESATTSEAHRVGAIALEPGDLSGLVEAMEDAWLGKSHLRSNARETVAYDQVAPQFAGVFAGMR